jgi:hypothetical protein
VNKSLKMPPIKELAGLVLSLGFSFRNGYVGKLDQCLGETLLCIVLHHAPSNHSTHTVTGAPRATACILIYIPLATLEQ